MSSCRAKAKCLESLKKTVLEFMNDVIDYMVPQMYQGFCLGFTANFKPYPEITLMRDSIEILLPKKQDIESRKGEIIMEVLGQFFFRVTKTKIPFNIDYRGLSEQDKESIWNYLSITLAITEAYKKNP